MLQEVTSRWWLFLIRGIIAVVFGIAAAMWPQISLPVIVLIFGAYALVDGIFAIAGALSPMAGQRWWALLLEGILGLVVAFLVFTQPGLSAAAFVFAVGFWSIFTGVMEIVAGIQLRDILGNEWLYILAGIVSIAFGVLVIRYPDTGALGVVYLFAWYAIIFGILQLALGYRLQKMNAVTRGPQTA